MLEHTLETFQKHERINEIYIVANEEHEQNVLKITEKHGFTKIVQIVKGGTERYLSTFAALNAIQQNNNTTQHINVAIHDSARMLVTPNIIEQCISKLDNFQAVTTGTYTTDTVVHVNSSNIIQNIPQRNTLRAVQTPQCFQLDTIAKAYLIAMEDTNLQVTDDCGIIAQYMPHIPIAVVMAQEPNHKLTTPDDIVVMEALMRAKQVRNT